MINYSHPARRPWISLNTSWSSSILASHQEPINALELSKYWGLNHKLTIKFLNNLNRSWWRYKNKFIVNYASFISWGILSVSAMSEETAFISFFLQEAQYYCKNICKVLFFLNACINYAKFICMKSFAG